MSDLSEFLLARIAEDEERVRSFAASDSFPRGMVVRKHFRIQLAECEAKRRIVERYGYLHEHGDSGDMRWVLPLLALPYADCEGYDESWRP